MFEFMRNIFASEQPILEKYNIVDPSAVGESKVRPITIAMTPPTEEATSTSVSLFWSDSENKVYEKTFENQEEAQNIFASLKSDLQEVAELTKDEKLDAAESLVTELMSRYDVHTDKLVEGNPPPATTTLAEKESDLHSKSPEELQALIDNWMERMPEVTDKSVLYMMRNKIKEVQEILTKKTSSKKEAKVVMQNIFFETPEEAAAFQEKFKKNEPGKGDKPPMAGDFEDDLGLGNGDDKDLGLGEEDSEIGPPSLSHKDFEKDKAKEQKSLTKRIEKEVKDQVKSNLDQKIASNFGAKEDALLDAMRELGRTWEEIREYFVKGLRYDEDSVVYYLDQRKTQESPELVDDKPEAPKPPENLVTPETHDELVDELLDEKPVVPKVDEVEEIKKKDIPMRDKEIANSLTTEIEKKAEEPLETVPSPSGTADDMYPQTEFKDTSDDMDDNTNEPEEIGDAPQEEIPEEFHPGESVYVMGDYETGTKGYEGEFVSEYTSEGEDYAVIDIGMNEMKEVPKRFVKKASYKETLKKKAVATCEDCKGELSSEEYMTCKDCKEKAKKKKELVMARLVKAGVDKELVSRSLNLIKADIDELSQSVTADPVPVPTKKPVMQPATEPSETPQEVPTKYKPYKKSPDRTKEKEIDLGHADAQKVYQSFSSHQQKLDSIKAMTDDVKSKAKEQIMSIEKEHGLSREQKQFQAAVEKLALLVDATKDKVMKLGKSLFTFIHETKTKDKTFTAKEDLDAIYEWNREAKAYIDGLHASAQKAVQTVTTKELIESPSDKLKQSSIETEASALTEALEAMWDNAKALFDLTTNVEQKLGAVASKESKVEKKAHELKLWNPGKNYMGEEFVDYYMGPTRTRDSESLEESNFDVALKQLGGESDGVIVQRAGHWGVGWVEVILVHKDAKEKVEILQNIMNQIEEYPVLDEEDYSQREQDKQSEAIDDWALDDAAKILGLNLEELSDQQKQDITQAIYDTFSDSGELYLDEKVFKSYYEEATDRGQQREEYNKPNDTPEVGGK